MLMRVRIACLLALALATGCSRADSIPEGVLEGTVTYVYDGDTVSLSAQGREYRVRLQGIDAPEHDQPYGNAARRHLERLVLNKAVRLNTMGEDRYGRLLGKLWVRPADCPRCDKTLDANLAMLTVGAAWWYRAFREDQSEEDRGRYEFAEFEARGKSVGLWQDEEPTPPWDWPRGAAKSNRAPDGGR